MNSIRQILRDTAELFRMPSVTINLMRAETRNNDPFFEKMVDSFYRETQERRWKIGLIKRWQYGVALCVLPETFDEYFMTIEAAARRNYKKAMRLGYTFERIRHNDWLDGMSGIHASADERQGQMPDGFVATPVAPNTDPPSKTNVHDYPYFGVLKDGKLVAYSGNMVAGELFMIEQMYGHASFQADGVVPFLVIGMAKYTMEHYPSARYYAYERYFGSSETMRRFKRKFGFLPHRVKWKMEQDRE